VRPQRLSLRGSHRLSRAHDAHPSRRAARTEMRPSATARSSPVSGGESSPWYRVVRVGTATTGGAGWVPWDAGTVGAD
jgi:hypothetical protein